MTKKDLLNAAPLIAVIVLLVALCGLGGYLFAQWPVIDPPLKPPIISGAFTILAAMGGALVVFWQLRTQAANTLRANRESEKMKLKKDIYDKIIPTVEVASDSQVKFLWCLSRFLMDINNFRQLPSWKVQANSNELIALFEKCHAGCVAIIQEAQRWEIADPRVEIFRTAFNAASFDLIEANTDYANFVFRFMPNSPADPQRVTATSPTAEETLAIGNLTVMLATAIHGLMYFTRDFQVEMQNHLLGELFGHQVRQRSPMENEPKVVRLQDHIEMQRYFENETPWGRERAKKKKASHGPLTDPMETRGSRVGTASESILAGA